MIKEGITMVVRLSPVRATGAENDQFLGRLTRAQDEDRVSESLPIDAMLKRGKSGRVPRHQSLAERDGDWS
jgi:hypothetical protein